MDQVNIEEVRARNQSEKEQPALMASRKSAVPEENYLPSREPEYKEDYELNITRAGTGKKSYQNADNNFAGPDLQQHSDPKKDSSAIPRREELPVVVAESSKVLESPLDWEECWTTNSDESSTISVLQSEVSKGVTKNDNFQLSDSFDFLRTQNLDNKEEKKEEKTKLTSDPSTTETSTCKPRQSEEQPAEKHLPVAPIVRETFENDSDSSTVIDCSEKDKRPHYSEVGRSYRRELSPHYRQELSPSPTFRSRDSSATRFVAIDAYLGIKDKEAGEAQDDKRSGEKKDRPFSYRSNHSLDPKPFRDNSSLERNKSNHKRKDEVLRDQGRDIKEERKYSEDYLTVDCSREQDERSVGHTDDSKSYYKRNSAQLLEENAELLKHSRSTTPTHREDREEEKPREQQVRGPRQEREEARGSRQELPGFLAKTPHYTPAPQTRHLEQDVHFEAEFPTFSAYLRRTYGQTYSYRTRDNSESEDNPARYQTKTDGSGTAGSVQPADSEEKKTKEKEFIESKGLTEDQRFSDCLQSKKESRYKEVEHNSRKSNYQQQGNKDQSTSRYVNGEPHIPHKDLSDKFLSTSSYASVDPKDTNNFLSRSKESVFETYGEVSSGSAKQLNKNSSAGRAKSSKVDQREASPTIDLLQRSFESLQSALINKELDLMSPSAAFQKERRMSPSPERLSEERRSDSSHSRSRSRTRKRTVQSQSQPQARSRDSSQKLRLKEMAPTYYEARHGCPGDLLTNNNAQHSPSLSEIEVIYKGAEPENYNLNKKYIERYPMDFNDEDISVMKKFIHHKKDELPEMFYMDVETFKKYYVQNRVMEMKRESSGSRRSSLSSLHELDTLEREASLPRESGREKDIYQAGPHQSRLAAVHQGLSGANIGLSHSPHPHSPARYESPSKRSVAVQIQQVLTRTGDTDWSTPAHSEPPFIWSGPVCKRY